MYISPRCKENAFISYKCIPLGIFRIIKNAISAPLASPNFKFVFLNFKIVPQSHSV